MKKILIFGAGGFGREVLWLIERINAKETCWQVEGFLDDGVMPGTVLNGYTVLGGIEKLKEYDRSTAIVCAIGSARTREKILAKIKETGNFEFPNLIDPDVQMSETVSMGEGNIICAGNILTVNISIGDFNIINLSCTVGHDVVMESYVTVYPGVNISGCTEVKQGTELGTGSKIIQGKTIGKNTVVGAGAVVVSDLPPECTAMGVPAKPVKFSEGGGYKKLLIVGASGHGRVIAELAQELGCYEEIAFLDDRYQRQKEQDNVLGASSYAMAHKEEYDVIVAIGNEIARKKLQERYEAEGVCVVSLIHPAAVVAEDVEMGTGTVVMAGAVIQTGTAIGNGVIVNTACSIDHECVIGDYAHISVGSHLAGNVSIGTGTWVGAGAVVSNNITVCENTKLGAGAVAVKDINESGVYVGVPAKRLKK